MENKSVKEKHLRFGEDFEPELDKFEKFVKGDKEIINSIPEKDKKRTLKLGLFNHAIKFLIKKYNQFMSDNNGN